MCYHCGETGHFKQQCPEIRAYDVCFRCRKSGHSVADCPEGGGSGGNGGEGEKGGKGKKKKPKSICYNCGSKRHTLKRCKKEKIGSGLDFASCYVCGKQGHLASKCPENMNGIYPNGGCCKRCGSVYHLLRDCDAVALKKQMATAEADGGMGWHDPGTLEYVVHRKTTEAKISEANVDAGATGANQLELGTRAGGAEPAAAAPSAPLSLAERLAAKKRKATEPTVAAAEAPSGPISLSERLAAKKRKASQPAVVSFDAKRQRTLLN
ncbi:Zf-CCHC type zinc finger protein [Thecamonas trahens ATCC 50062]|uniref:Zf-CCHC type zinc finger protein n=1 Tax=Thecamonas trahens ATCC 50062 TaxID=461836 RepID=A0A0L0D278_THETB|nr:Zf-CCHC type zinc finger protein [Thecamonas trahens ATCC 50062]KNC46306.1 Zf-CCHC type zinc finger protein [Thecamonas trahens ATCC 50062]|eukprot:XP_013760599.1 Zf-CCHC type zinc finger protein [Thecamonas trahens ATCC 50062]